MNFKRVLVGVGGGIVLVAGIAMIVLPGPAVAVIPLGLTILAPEFPWARRSLDRIKNVVRRRSGKSKTATVESQGLDGSRPSE